MTIDELIKSWPSSNLANPMSSTSRIVPHVIIENEFKKNVVATGVECRICMEDKISHSLSCGHVFCHNCAIRFMTRSCAICRRKPDGCQRIYLF